MKQLDFKYEPPKIEVIEVEVEGGFCTSGGFGPDTGEGYNFN